MKTSLPWGSKYDYVYISCCSTQLVELSKAQDIEAGDGTTSVVVVAGSLLEAAEKLLQRGIHPTIISDSFQHAAAKAVEILAGMSQPIELTDKESLIKSASTALNSKVHIIISHGHEDHLFSGHHLANLFPLIFV
jgi:glyoxylase-like metal-dependent hydrolase (beta-lactamase superfamily II)